LARHIGPMKEQLAPVTGSNKPVALAVYELKNPTLERLAGFR
jgi:hypothetical protein